MRISFLLIVALYLPNITYASEQYVEQIKRVDECTRLAEIFTIDSLGIPGVSSDNIQVVKAKKACRESRKLYPDDPHVLYLLARVNIADNNSSGGFKLAKESCKKGDTGGCTLLGWCYDKGIYIERRNTKKAYRLWLDACDQGNPQACHNVAAVMGRNLSYIPKDTEEVKSYFLQACKSGIYVHACTIFADEVYFGRLFSDPESYEYALTQSCVSGVKGGCYPLEKYLNEKNDPDKEKKLFDSFKKSCERNNTRACKKIKIMKKNKEGVMWTYTHFEKRCIGGDKYNGCRYAGKMKIQPNDIEKTSIEKNIPLGISYLEASCYEGRNPIACQDLGSFYVNTAEKQYNDPKKAIAPLRQACKIGNYTIKLGCELNIDICCMNKRDEK